MPTNRSTKAQLKSVKPANTRSKGSTFRGVYTPSASDRAHKKSYSQSTGGMSVDRKLDLIGIVLLLLGLIGALSLFSGDSTAVTGWISGVLGWLSGWGSWIIPLGLIVTGLYLILRKFDSIPRPRFEQIAGLILLYLNILTLLNFFTGELKDVYTLAEAGMAGGIIGGLLLTLLVQTLGGIGAFLVLCAWLLIALIFSFDLSFQQIFHATGIFSGWVKTNLPNNPGLFKNLSSQWQGLRTKLAPEFSSSAPFYEEESPEDELETDLDGDFVPISAASEHMEQVETAEVDTKPQILPEPVWKLPDPEKILEHGSPAVENEKMNLERARVIEETLADFGAPGHVVEILRGPSVTMFGVEPDFIENRSGNHTRVRVSKIVSLSDDLALALAATRIRIQAPVPGRNYVGIEVPNDNKSMVRLRDVFDSSQFKRIKSTLRIALGKDVSGIPVAADLTAMPHLLIAGTTGSGKSVCVNAILSCLLMNNTPDDLRLILVDPKRVEFTSYNGIPHLLAPVVVDAEKVIGALQWMLREMDARYHKFSAVGARNLEDFNIRMQLRGEKKLPKLVIVIDELADLMMLAPSETQAAITRLAQMARATGLHLVVATQRPSTDVITGLIKANFPSRIAFSVATMIDSRVILDQPGAEDLLGHGDMLYQAPDAASPIRVQGVFVSDMEIQKLVDYWRGVLLEQAEGSTPEATEDAQPVSLPPSGMLKQVDFWTENGGRPNDDPLLDEVKELVRREGRASISMLQRRLRIGYTRAARLVDRLEELKIIGPAQANTQVREVLDYGQTIPPADDGA